jgi:hypothetical protein
MTREELLERRDILTQTLKERRALGEFDTNSKVILILLEVQLMTIQHLLDTTKKS